MKEFKVGDKVKIREDFWKDISRNTHLLPLKNKILTVIELQPYDKFAKTKLTNCVKLDKGIEGLDNFWATSWLEKVGEDLKVSFVEKVMEYLKGSKNGN